MLFNDTLSQKGHSVSCMTILFENLQITRSDIWPHKVGRQPGDCIWSLFASSGV